MKGYKVFNPDWTCREFQYKVGETYHMEGEIKYCRRGFYFSKKPLECFRYYTFDPRNKVAEVEAIGEILTHNNKIYCTNTIKIVKELLWEEVLELVNVGVDNTGYDNTGNHNSGNYNSGENNSGNYNSGDENSGDGNSGDGNSGNWNSGHWNSGDCNCGNWNSGDANTGDCNSGYWNSGNHNSGNGNYGDWNSGDGNTGIFNTESPKMTIFDAPSSWTYNDWETSYARNIMSSAPLNYSIWITADKMTEKEKYLHPDFKITGGYIRCIDLSSRRQQWWDELPDEKKKIVMSLPNFDATKFEICTGIKIKQD